MVEISDLQVEHFRPGSVFGIGVPAPRLSWKVIGAPDGWTQSKYEIQLLSSTGAIVDSCSRQSSQSVLVDWPFSPIESKKTARVRLKAWSDEGAESEYSEAVSIETGILSRAEWNGSLIESTIAEDANLPQPETYFRRSFTVKQTPKSARLYITAHGVFEAFVNGEKVSDDVLAPGWSSYTHRIREHVYDISSLVVKGENVVGVAVAEGWYSGRLGWRAGCRNVYGERVGVLANLDITYNDGSDVVVTDADWKAAHGPARTAEIYDGEKYDASYEIPDWAQPSCDLSAWSSVSIKPIPNVEIFLPFGPTAKPIETVKPVNLITTSSGRQVLDFGQNLVGVLELKLPPAGAGHVITLVHAEVLEAGEVAVRPLRAAKATDSYTYKGGKSRAWRPRFTFHGFRYAQIEGWPGELTLDSVTAIVIHNDFKRTGWFKTSNAMINQLHENVRWSLKGNFLELPTDCPQRDERLGWTGDIQVFTPTAMYYYDVSGLLASWLRDLYEEQREYGGVPGVVVPDILHKLVDTAFPSLPHAVWQDASIIVPWGIYRATGDAEILETQYQSMVDWLRALPRQKDGVRWGKQRMQLGDWLDPAAPPDTPEKALTDSYLVADAYLVYVTELMIKISQILGKHKEAEYYTQQAAACKAAFRMEYVTPSGRVLSDTQCAYALAIRFGLLTAEEEKHAGERLAEIVVANEYKIGTGFAGTPIICFALTKIGRVDLAYKMLQCTQCPSWLYPVTKGATTIWERWDSLLPNGTVNPGQMTSFNHYALGSVAEWMHEVIAGLRIARAGWKHVLIQPTPNAADLAFVDARFDGPYGVVESRWKIGDGRFELTVTIPPNSTASVVMPDGEKYEIKSGTKSFSCAHGV